MIVKWLRDKKDTCTEPPLSHPPAQFSATQAAKNSKIWQPFPSDISEISDNKKTH